MFAEAVTKKIEQKNLVGIPTYMYVLGIPSTCSDRDDVSGTTCSRPTYYMELAYMYYVLVVVTANNPNPWRDRDLE